MAASRLRVTTPEQSGAAGGRSARIVRSPKSDRLGHRPFVQLQQCVVAHLVIFFEGVVRSALPPSCLIFFAVFSIVST